MNNQYKIVQGDYKTEDDVVVQIDTTETVTNVISSVFNIGTIKKQIEAIDTQIVGLTEEKDKLQALLNSTKTLTKNAIKTNE